MDSLPWYYDFPGTTTSLLVSCLPLEYVLIDKVEESKHSTVVDAGQCFGFRKLSNEPESCKVGTRYAQKGSTIVKSGDRRRKVK